MNDPAFLFYSSDFLSGVTDLTMEERGQYITLLCLQHQKGTLSEKTIRLTIGSVSGDVIKKFTQNEDGYFYNKRLQSEIEKRQKFTESRRNNGSLGGRPKKDIQATKKQTKTDRLNLAKPKNNLIENENINENRVKTELELKLDEFYKFRKEMKKPVLETSKESFINSLRKLSNNSSKTAIEILDQSIANGWQGIFELKKDSKSTEQKLEPKLNMLK